MAEVPSTMTIPIYIPSNTGENCFLNPPHTVYYQFEFLPVLSVKNDDMVIYFKLLYFLLWWGWIPFHMCKSHLLSLSCLLKPKCSRACDPTEAPGRRSPRCSWRAALLPATGEKAPLQQRPSTARSLVVLLKEKNKPSLSWGTTSSGLIVAELESSALG